MRVSSWGRHSLPLDRTLCSSPAAEGAPDAAPGASPALSAALQQLLGSPTQEDAGVEGGTVPLWVHCPCPEVESSPTSSLQQLSPRFPLKDLHSLASRAVSLSFLPLLLESCTDESTGL